MSSDDGWLLTDTKEGKYHLQRYVADSPVTETGGIVFNSLEEAILKFQELNGESPTEYGLSVRLAHTKTNGSSHMIQTERYVRNPFYVDAVQITEENMEAVADWCRGQIRKDSPEEGTGEAKYIHVRVYRPLDDRQTKGYVGDWILYAGTGYKVYTDKAFTSSFEKAQEPEQKNHNVFEEQSS